MPAPTILFFDGVCGLCNRTVDFLLARDHARRLRFAPLQGETFAAVAQEHPELLRVDSVIAMEERPGGERRFHVHSRAVLFALRQLGGAWRGLRLLEWVPRPLSDTFYKGVARVRYSIWGKYERCRLPSPAERPWFLP